MSNSDELVLASPSFDMWSLGVVLFELCTGEPLFISNDEDNTDHDGLITLLNWTIDNKLRKLSKISDKNAHNLVSRQLNKVRHSARSHRQFPVRQSGVSSGGREASL